MKIKVGDYGEYDMPNNFTFREMNFIKKITGLRAGELYPALNAGDSDVYVAFALTAMRRSHSDVTEDTIMEMEIDEITLITEPEDEKLAEEAKEDPPDEGGAGSLSVVPPPNSPSPTSGTQEATG